MNPHAQLRIDPAELLGDAPDAAFDKTVVTAENRPRVHQRQGECRVRLAQGYRAAFGHRHGHVDLAAFTGEIVIQQGFGGAGYPQLRQGISEHSSRLVDGWRRRIYIAVLQEIDHPRFVRAERFDFAFFAPLCSEFTVELCRVAENPGRLAVAGKQHQLRVFRHERLQSFR